MRSRIITLLNNLQKTHKTVPKEGLYPPKINLSDKQTDEQIFNELKRFINYLEMPHYSYLTKSSK